MAIKYDKILGKLREADSSAETDPIVGAVTGIVKADGAGNISAATAGVDYVATESNPYTQPNNFLLMGA